MGFAWIRVFIYQHTYLILGQISGFTTMEDFKNRFAEYNHATGKHAFSNVRNGLIVGLVSDHDTMSSGGRLILTTTGSSQSEP